MVPTIMPGALPGMALPAMALPGMGLPTLLPGMSGGMPVSGPGRAMHCGPYAHVGA